MEKAKTVAFERADILIAEIRASEKKASELIEAAQKEADNLISHAQLNALTILKEEEDKAIKNREYELAIRWRDSIYKLERNLDIYDFVHIIDQMRAENRLGKYRELAKIYKEQYNKLVQGQPDK